MNQPNVQIKILDNRLKADDMTLSQGSLGSAGYDLRACLDETLVLQPGEVKLIPTGLAIFLDDPNYVGFILPRSGLGHKGLVLGNLVGTIDSDYQDVLKMSLWNRSTKPIEIQPLERVAQYVVQPVIHPYWQVVDEFHASTDRGLGGFNSTGTK